MDEKKMKRIKQSRGFGRKMEGYATEGRWKAEEEFVRENSSFGSVEAESIPLKKRQKKKTNKKREKKPNKPIPWSFNVRCARP